MTELDCPGCCSVIPIEKVVTDKLPSAAGGFHLKASCPYCKRFIRFLPHAVPTFYFGKYKGRLIAEIALSDAGYLKWFLTQDIKPVLRKQIEEALAHVVSD